MDIQEQILASHSQVERAAEFHYLLRVANETGLNRLDGIRCPQSILEQKPHQLMAYGEENLARFGAAPLRLP